MSTWLMDTPLFNMLATPKAKPLLEWCEANDASLFISAASLTEVARGISKLPGSQSQRANAQRNWLDEITHALRRSHPPGRRRDRHARWRALAEPHHWSPAPSLSRRPPRRDGADPRPWPDHAPRRDLRALDKSSDCDGLVGGAVGRRSAKLLLALTCPLPASQAERGSVIVRRRTCHPGAL